MKIRTESFTSGAWWTPLVSIAIAMVLGALIIALSGLNVAEAYGGLFKGAFGGTNKIAETLVAATPYVFGALAVSLAFQTGLFNVGVEGQILVGALTSALAGIYLGGEGSPLPAAVHIPLALLAGAAGGAFWAAIPGFLKVRFGSHEVINTIMLNYVAFYIVNFLISGAGDIPGPLHGPGDIPQTAYIQESAKLPLLIANTRMHSGYIVALLAVAATWFLLYKTTLGLGFRLVGANADAAENAGHPVKRYIVGAMALAGALAGLAGASEVMGVNYRLPDAFSSGYGFDAIAVALLGRSHPVGVLFAALLFGALRNGASLMQLASETPTHLISINQALIIFFLATGPLLTAWFAKRAAPAGR